MNLFDYFFESIPYPDKDFVMGRDETISYTDIYNSSLRLAEYLRQSYGENNSILIISYNSVFFIVSYLAIIKSGNICVPVNPEIEPHKLEFIIRKCSAKCIIMQDKLHLSFIGGANNVIPESAAWNIIQSSHFVPGLSYLHFDPDRLAEIIFTSGSTGEPKGVMITHLNIISNTNSIIEYLELSENDIIEVVLPFHYCYGLSLLHTHLRVNGAIVLNNNFTFIGSVISDLRRYECTGFAGVPSHYQIFLRKTRSFKTTLFPSLKYVTQAGGKLHNALILEFLKAFSTINFYVMYGQTEATARLSYLPPQKLPEKVGSIGKGIPGVDLELADDQGKIIATPGITGEIVARGDNIMKGYLGDKQGSENTLRNGWLHTGDLGYRDTEGYFYVTARKSEILKVRGKRVSPKEIEEIIISIPDVVDCSIQGIDDGLQGEVIKTSIVVSNLKNNRLTTDLVKRYCAERLEAFKVPHIVEFVEHFNVSATGKKVK